MEPTLADRAYQGLRQKLVRGELQAGQRLVNRVIAKELHVSQTPLREAINRLVSEGVFEFVPGAGAYVHKIDFQELLQLYDLREHLEPFAARRAARHITDAELLEMETICADWRRIARQIRDEGRASATPDEMLRWNDNEERFHALLLLASRNRWLTAIVGNLRLLAMAFAVQRQNPQMLSLRAAAITWREHVRIVRTLRTGDEERAEQMMRRHVAFGRSYVLESLQG
ncbi:MAG TPA: GntR family transcriptional regulator [Phycisphaerae bacterium]|nr:GntR family transcriptional regulator [Phycisphaerae bacterium]HRY66829.1 GntR family transcriptional regulator [Phycisphaerae bacterium]HSA26887.1 GntR family transcriptional regulator [Phycisphaerae bacterium]